MGTATNIDNQMTHSNVQLFYNQDEQTIQVIANDINSVKNVKLFAIDGQLIKSWETIDTKAYIENKLSTGIYIIEYEVNKLIQHKRILIN